jgi:hypothetical protein
LNQRKIKSLRSRLARLARNNCAGCSLPCVVVIETDSAIGNVCSYFMRSVLPADPALERVYLEYFPDDYLLKKILTTKKNCDRCRTPIELDGPNRKYCAECKSLAERDSKRRRMQRYRSG